MTALVVRSVGLAAPGLPDWAIAQGVLADTQPYRFEELPVYQPQLLPPNERRRATPAVRQAFRAAEQAVQGVDAGALATVFAGSDADMGILHRICAALAEQQRVVSPTDFHNSVHNAAAGYWGIAAGSRAASTTIAGYDGSFAAGLLEAAAQVAIDRVDTLLVAFDVPAPEPLLSARPLRCAGSCALVLATAGDGPRLAVSLSTEPETRLDDGELESLRLANPALRALPVLRLLARREAGTVVLPGSGGRTVQVTVTP